MNTMLRSSYIWTDVHAMACDGVIFKDDSAAAELSLFSNYAFIPMTVVMTTSIIVAVRRPVIAFVKKSY